MTDTREVRVFVASPDDMRVERARVEHVVSRLDAEFEGVARFRAIRYERSFYTADRTFQAQIPTPAQCDVVIVIFGHRLGSELPPDFEERLLDGTPYPSGTAYELLSSLAAADARVSAGGDAVPAVYVFRKTAEPRFGPSEEAAFKAAQRESARLHDFFDRLFLTPSGGVRRAFHQFAGADDFEDQVDDLLHQWARRSLRLPVLWDIEKSGSRFRGLQPFDARHSRIFFGRDRKVRRALDELVRTRAREPGRPFLLVVGPSGSGKSSLVRAGVIPRMVAAGAVSDVDRWRVAVMRPGEGPTAFHALAQALCVTEERDTGGFGPALPELMSSTGQDPSDLAETLSHAGPSSVEPIIAVLDGIGASVRQAEGYERTVRVDLLLLVDQLEEIFATSVTDAERSAFGRLLTLLVDTRRIWIIATLRADLYPQILDQRLPFLALKDRGGSYDLASPGESELREILERSAAAADLVYDQDPATGESLDELLLHDASGADALPLLQFSLKELFDRRGPVQTPQGERVGLTLAAYRELGGLDGAIDQVAEAAIRDPVTGAARRDFESALPRLLRGVSERVRAGGSTTTAQAALTARPVAVDALARDAAAHALIDRLVETRLLVSDRTVSGQPSVRLAHERVLTSWKRAQRIIDAHRAYFDVMSDLKNQCQRWVDGGRTQDFLLAGVPLARADDMVREYGDEVPQDLRQFVVASGRRARRRQRVRTLVAAGVAAVLAIAAIFGALTWSAEQRAAGNFNAAKSAADSLITDVADSLETQTTVSSDTLNVIYKVTDGMLDGLEATGRQHDNPLIQRVQGAWNALRAAIVGTKEAQPNEETAIRGSRATLLYRFADIYHRLATDEDRAEEKAKQSLRIRQELVAAGDTSTRALADVGLSQIVLSDIERAKIQNASTLADRSGRADFSPARALLEPALKTFTDLNAAQPNTSEWERSLSQVLTRLGDLDLRAGRDTAAAERFERARVISLRAFKGVESIKTPRDVHQQLDDAKATNELAWTYRKLGDLRVLQKRFADAAAAYRDDVCVRRKLAVADPSNINWTSNLGWSLIKLGSADVNMQPSNTAEAHDAFFEALTVRIGLVNDDNSKKASFDDFAQSLTLIGDMYRGTGNSTLADIYSGAAQDVRKQIAAAFPDLSKIPDETQRTMTTTSAATIRNRGPMAMILDPERRSAIEAAVQAFSVARPAGLRDATGCWDALMRAVSAETSVAVRTE